MARLALLIVCSAILFASNYVDSQGIGAKVETFSPIESKLENKTVSKNLTKTIVDEKKDDKNNSKNLTKEEIKPKSRIARQAILPAQPISILYHLGKRVNGDRLLASVPVVQQWTELQNITQTLNYPKNGTGGVITYVEVIVDQTSNLGRASAPTGGIGQRSISVIIEAQKTLLYRSTAAIYGQ